MEIDWPLNNLIGFICNNNGNDNKDETPALNGINLFDFNGNNNFF